MRDLEQNHTNRMRIMSGISAALGAWLVIAPAVLGIPAGPFARSGVVAGVLIILFSVIRFLSRHTTVLSCATALAGAWVIMSPWVFSYLTSGFRTGSYVLVGALVAVIAALSLTSSAAKHPWAPKGMTAGKPDKLLR
jgi:hypothetical protein